MLADRKRVENLKAAEREAQRLKDEAARLRSMSGGFSNSTSRTASATSVLAKKPFIRETPNYPSLVSVSNSPVKVKPKLSPEMEERERLARQETERKKKRVAVLYNKGAYQYISDEMDPTTIGKK